MLFRSGPAIFIPDVLRITVGVGGTSGVNGGATTVIYQAKDSTGYTLLTANGGGSGGANTTAGVGATATANNYFGAAGIYTSTAGQNGSAAEANLNKSDSTFLSGGSGGMSTTNIGTTVVPNYGYPTSVAAPSGEIGRAHV